MERDVRQIKNIGDISQFQRFMQLVAGRVGQLFNASSIANEVGVESKTITSWFNILEASYITFRLVPYFKNFGKRIVKSPKIYFYDVGLLAYLLGINNQSEMDIHFARGALFENLIVAEAKKHIFNNSLNIRSYFWRDNNGNEIDLLLDKGNDIDTVEIKASQGYKSGFSKGFVYWDNLNTKTKGKKSVVYTGEIETKTKDYNLVNWKNVNKIFAQNT